MSYTTTVLGVSEKNKGVQLLHEGSTQWFTVVGKAADYVKADLKNATVDYDVKDGNITFIRKSDTGSSPKPSQPTRATSTSNEWNEDRVYQIVRQNSNERATEILGLLIPKMKFDVKDVEDLKQKGSEIVELVKEWSKELTQDIMSTRYEDPVKNDGVNGGN